MASWRLGCPIVLSLILSGCAGPDASTDEFLEGDEDEDGTNPGPGAAPANPPTNPKGAAPSPGSSGEPTLPSKKPKTDEGPRYTNQTVDWKDGKLGTKFSYCSNATCTTVPVTQDQNSKKIDFSGFVERGALELQWNASTPTTKSLKFDLRGCKPDCATPLHAKNIKGPSPLPLQFEFEDWKQGEELWLEVTPMPSAADSVNIPIQSGPGLNPGSPTPGIHVVYEQPFEVHGTLTLREPAST